MVGIVKEVPFDIPGLSVLTLITKSLFESHNGYTVISLVMRVVLINFPPLQLAPINHPAKLKSGFTGFTGNRAPSDVFVGTRTWIFVPLNVTA